MKAVFLFAMMLSPAIPALAQESCGFALGSSAETQARVVKSFQSLKSLLGGSPVNASIAVDRILMEVQLNLEASQSQRVADSLISMNSLSNAQEKVDSQQAALKKLDEAVSRKADGFLQRFKKSSLKNEVEQRLAEVTAGRETLADLMLSISQNIEKIRGQQLEAEAWETKVNSEIEYLQGMIAKVSEEAEASAKLSRNFEEEIFPRILQQANSLMSQQLLMVRSVSTNLALRVTAEQTTLDNIKSLQRLASEVSMNRAKAFLDQELGEAKIQESRAALNEAACVRKELCVGEKVYFWYKEVGANNWEPKDARFGKIISRYEDGYFSVRFEDKSTEKKYPAFLARAQKGLTSGGISVGDIVVDKGSSYYKIVGIFNDGNFLAINVVRGKLFFSENRGEKSRRFFAKFTRDDIAKIKYF